MSNNGARKGDGALIAALASGKTHTDAAKLAGVSLRTLTRRLNDPAFRQQVLQARAALIEKATGRLADSATRAADELVELLADESATVRLSAARALLDYAGRFTEANDVHERITALEDAVSHHQPALQPMKGGKAA